MSADSKKKGKIYNMSSIKANIDRMVQSSMKFSHISKTMLNHTYLSEEGVDYLVIKAMRKRYMDRVHCRLWLKLNDRYARYIEGKYDELTDYITCPHCNYEDPDSIKFKPHFGNTKCEKCKKIFWYQRRIDIKYYTSKAYKK